MNPTASDTLKPASGFSIDTPIAIFLIAVGVFGLRLAGSADKWRQITDEPDDRIPVGFVESVQGQARFRRAFQAVWEDLSAQRPASEGDVIYTDDKSIALLTIKAKNQIRIAPGSLVVVRVEDRKGSGLPENDTWWSRFTRSVDQDSFSRFSFEVKKGAVEVVPEKGGMPVRFRAGGQKFQLEREGDEGTLKLRVQEGGKVEFDPSTGGKFNLKTQGKEGAVRVEKSADITIQPKAQTFDVEIPRLEAPLSGASMVTNSGEPLDIALRWKPLSKGLVTEIEVVGKEGSKDFKLGIESGRSGAIVSLSAGHYSWKVRSKPQGAQASPSAWSEAHELTVTAVKADSKEAPAPLMLALSGGRKVSLKKMIEETKKAPPPAPVVADVKGVQKSLPKPVKLAPFHQPFLVEPKAGATLDLLGKGIFTWERVTAADSFEIQISQDGTFKTFALQNVRSDNFLLFRPQTAGTYRWRVRSIKAKKESPWSEVRIFKVK